MLRNNDALTQLVKLNAASRGANASDPAKHIFIRCALRWAMLQTLAAGLYAGLLSKRPTC